MGYSTPIAIAVIAFIILLVCIPIAVTLSVEGMKRINDPDAKSRIKVNMWIYVGIAILTTVVMIIAIWNYVTLANEEVPVYLRGWPKPTHSTQNLTVTPMEPLGISAPRVITWVILMFVVSAALAVSIMSFIQADAQLNATKENAAMGGSTGSDSESTDSASSVSTVQTWLIVSFIFQVITIGLLLLACAYTADSSIVRLTIEQNVDVTLKPLHISTSYLLPGGRQNQGLNLGGGGGRQNQGLNLGAENVNRSPQNLKAQLYNAGGMQHFRENDAASGNSPHSVTPPV